MTAKMICQSVTNYGNTEEVKLTAVTGSEGENGDFNTATPYAELKMMIDNPKARGYFKPDKEYYLDFTEAK